MRRRTAAVFAVVLLVTVVAGSFVAMRVRPTDMTPTPTRPPVPTIQPAPEGQVSPVLVQRMPAQGEELRPDGAVALVFDRAMDKASVEAALQIAPAVSGTMSWPDARTVVWTPNAQLPRASQFGVTVGQNAQAQDGATLAAPLRWSFDTSGYLEVGQVVPASGASDVATTSTITVMFNRPAVPLTPVEQQNTLPQPLSFEPAVAGRGEWLNTAIYTFTPAARLQSGANYTVRIAPDLKDATGNPMQSAFSWQFSTARPQILAVSPQDGASGVSVEPTVRVQFNGPVGADVQQTVLRDPNGAVVPTRAELLTDTLLLTPTTRLAFDSSYRVEVPANLGASAGGQGLETTFTSSFRTAPLPRILNTTPADGATDVQPWVDFTITFNAPIDPKTIMPNVRITPTISATSVYTYYDETSYTFHIGMGEQPSKDFTVEVGPSIADPFGNTIGQNLVVRFRTAPLPPNAYLAMPPFGTYSPNRPARIMVQATNQNQANIVLYQLPPNLLKQSLYRLYEGVPNGAQELRRWTAQLNAPLNKATLNQVDLLENGGALASGIYLVDMGGQAYGQRHLLVVSPLNVTLKSSLGEALVWANDLQTGKPAPNITFDIYEESDQAQLLGSATTDANGVARLRLERENENGLVAVAREPFAAMGTNWAQTINRWEFASNSQFYAPGLFAYAYTDRPIYRPGQTVHFKGLVRNENDAQFTLPQNANLVVNVLNANGETTFNQPLSLNANGMFSGEVTLPAGAPLGDYQIIMQLGDRSFANGFKVAAYRPPEFAVTVSPNQPEAFRGEATNAKVQAKYLFGAPLANAAATWNVLAEPYRFAPEWASRFQFGEDHSMGRCWECWWLLPVPPQPILQGQGTTDAQGNLSIAIPADVLDRWTASQQTAPNNGQGTANKQSARLIIEAVVTGRDNQVIAGREEVVVHTAGMYVGLASQTYIGTAGKPQAIDIVTADTAGKPLANQRVALEFQRVTWESRFVQDERGDRWESAEKIETVGTQTATTDGNAQATGSFTPDVGGAYRVVARARDANGREARSSITTWVAGTDYVPWLRDNNDRITLVADKNSYKPGETAQILIPSPFQGEHYALITVERAGIRSVEVRQVSSNSILFQLPITADDAPNLYVSVVLFKGGENGALAEFKAGVLPITVEPTAQMLNVKLTPSAPQAEPGTTMSYDVEVTDANGRGVAAELSLDLVDKGVLSLQPRRANDIGETLYQKRGLGVATSVGLAISGERTLEQATQSTGGRGAAGGDNAGMPAPAGAPMPTAAAAEAASSDASANRAQQGPAPTVRENFADTAYWNASILTDANGRGRVDLVLPDNLTTWVMRGVGLTADTHAGEGTVELVATKPLLVRPVTPRFFTVGDTAQLAANITNNTDAPMDATVSLLANGMTVTGEITQTVQIPARGETQVEWNATAQDATIADLTFSATAGSYSDASKPRLAGANGIPIYRYSAPEIVGTGGQLSAAGARGEVVALPPNVDERNGELTVRLDPSLASGVRGGLRALEHYEYECAEQTVSRFLPNVLTARALKELGVPNAELEAKLPNLVGEGVQRLAAQQNSDGGWGWWPQNQSNPHVSAYVVFGLARARAAGFTVGDDILRRGQEYLITQLKPTDSANARVNLSANDANQQAFVLFALGESGRGDGTKAGELFQVREKLAIYARASLAMTLQTTGAPTNDSRIKALLSDLNNAAIMSATGAHWEENQRDYWSMNTDTRTTAIALEALTRLDGQNQLNPNVVRWLMVARKDQAWETTQESAWSLMALANWMTQTGELQAAYDYGVKLNDTQLAAGRVTPETADQPVVLQIKLADMLRDTGNVLTIGRGDGQGQLYYTAHLRAFLPVEAIKALDRGIVVTRRYVLASCTDGAACPEVTEAKVGDVLRVELSIVAPNDLHYLVVEDPLFAGVEAIDPNLATTSLLEGQPTTDDRQPIPLLERGDSPSNISRPWSLWYARTELRDEKVALFADFLPKGAYTFSYTVRATQAGDYRAIPTTASEMYFPEVYGRGDAAMLQVQN